MGKKKKAMHTIESPNAMSFFWKQRCAQEVNGRYKSTVHNIITGKIKHEPISTTQSSMENHAIREARKLRDQHFKRKVRVPRDLFKSKRIVLPIINKNFSSLNKTMLQRGLRRSTKRRGIKCFETDQKMSWMNSSIDLSYIDGRKRNQSLSRINAFQSLQNIKEQSRRRVFSLENSPVRDYHSRNGSTHSLRDKRIEIAKNRHSMNTHNEYSSK